MKKENLIYVVTCIPEHFFDNNWPFTVLSGKTFLFVLSSRNIETVAR